MHIEFYPEDVNIWYFLGDQNIRT